jgi:glutaminyl-tRNA synthetase
MKNGEFEEGAMSLRAKIDMASPNMNMRDPVMYRILKKPHHRTGEKWKIYPMYDWAHGESDYIEQISHSLCSLEFENHRPLYEWYLDQVYDDGKVAPKQREFARMNVSYMVTSKENYKISSRRYNNRLGRSKNADNLRTEKKRLYTNINQKLYRKSRSCKKRNLIDIQLLEFL